MKYDTAGNLIVKMTPNCNCGLTAGCANCNLTLYKKKLPSWIGCITDKEAEEMKNFVADWNARFNNSFKSKRRIGNRPAFRYKVFPD